MSRAIDEYRSFTSKAKQDQLLLNEEIRRSSNANEDLKGKIDGVRGEIEDCVMRTEQVLASNQVLRGER